MWNKLFTLAVEICGNDLGNDLVSLTSISGHIKYEDSYLKYIKSSCKLVTECISNVSIHIWHNYMHSRTKLHNVLCKGKEVIEKLN